MLSKHNLCFNSIMEIEKEYTRKLFIVEFDFDKTEYDKLRNRF